MRKAYPTDLTNAQWEYIRAIIPPAVAKPGCELTDLREIANALLYQNKSGCQWDLLPHDLPPKSTAHDYYRRWRADGSWDKLLDALRRRTRAEAGRAEEPSAAVADSQSASTTQVGGEQRGYDGGKKVKGRKRHVLVDTTGLLLAVAVTAANVSDGRAAPAVLGRLPLPTRGGLQKIYADGRYHDTVFRKYLERYPHIDLEIVSRPQGARGFVVIKKRWVVERTFAWGMTYRRLSRDYEKQVASSESRVKMAAIHTMLKRLTKHNGRVPGLTHAAPEMGRKVA
jgi:putative transposase